MPLLPPETTLYPSDLLARPADPGAEARWWVIHTRPRAEKNLARKLLAGDIPARGAFPCVGFISLKEFADHLAPFGISVVRGENGVWSAP